MTQQSESKSDNKDVDIKNLTLKDLLSPELYKEFCEVFPTCEIVSSVCDLCGKKYVSRIKLTNTHFWTLCEECGKKHYCKCKTCDSDKALDRNIISFDDRLIPAGTCADCSSI